MSNRQYDFTLAAVLGSSARIDARGSKLRVLSSPAGPVGVKIDGGPELQLLEGQGFNMGPGRTFRDVVVRNLQAVGNVGSIFIGEEGFEDSRITGTVRVIDSSRDKVTAGNAYAGCMSQGGGAQPTRVQMQNPVASGRNLWVSAVTVGMSASESIGVTMTDTLFTQSNGSSAVNLNPGGAASVALLRYDDVNVAVTAIKNMRLGYGTANQDRVILFPNPIMVPPGKGLYVVGASSANVMRVSFEFEEYAA